VTSGLVFYMHQVPGGGKFFIASAMGLGACAFQWAIDIIDEATRIGYHTKVVRKGLRLGF